MHKTIGSHRTRENPAGLQNGNKCNEEIFTKGRGSEKAWFCFQVINIMFWKQNYMFTIAKTGENDDILKIMNYFDNFEILTLVFLVIKKWSGQVTIH